MKRASGNLFFIRSGATGHANVCIEASSLSPDPEKQSSYSDQFGSLLALTNVPLCVATTFGSFGSDRTIPGCWSMTWDNQVVPALGTPTSNTSTSATLPLSRAGAYHFTFIV